MSAPGEPYGVRLYPAADAGSVLLVGFDGRGAPLVEIRVPTHDCTEATIAELRRLLQLFDDSSAA